VASTLSVLVFLAVVTAPGAQRTGSAQFQVSVRVVAPLRASAPDTVELRQTGDLSQAVNGVRLGATTKGHGRAEAVVARLTATASLRGGTAAVLIGLPGGPAQTCPDGGACELALARAAGGAAAGEAVVVTFLPDGAPSALVER
jgi:hypothetical protein